MSTMRARGSNPPFFLSANVRGVGLDGALPHTDRAEAADPPRITQQFALDGEALLAVLVDGKPRAALAELGIDVVPPETGRRQDVAVGINRVVGGSHDPSPFGCVQA